MLIVELGIKLDKDFEYYDNVLKSNGLVNDFKVKTHDIYYTNKNLDMKKVSNAELKDFENILIGFGYRKVFDTTKKDFHYYKDGMSSKVQLQQIENIGLLVYLDNKDYYEFDLETQRKMLIDELNSYGFDFDYNILGLDKLRTLYYGKEMYSNNQNG